MIRKTEILLCGCIPCPFISEQINDNDEHFYYCEKLNKETIKQKEIDFDIFDELDDNPEVNNYYTNADF